jgi:hypothetical protein
MSHLWDINGVDDYQAQCIEEVDNIIKNKWNKTTASTNAESMIVSTPNTLTNNEFIHHHNSVYKSIETVEMSCRTFIDGLDDILSVLDQISLSHRDVTMRTNVLMNNCESLLERQVIINCNNILD